MEKYIFEKDKLPKPIYEGRDDLVSLYYLAWETAFKKIDYVDKEGWKPILTCMPGVGITWQWDSCFLTFFTNYSGGTLSAFNNLDNLYRLQRDCDGYISMAYRIESETEAYGERINPPLYAWAEWEHYLISGDSSRFEYVLPKIEKLYNFIENTRKRKYGLYYFEDTGSSGMDNSPRGAFPSSAQNGSDVCHVDLACQQSLSALYMSKMFSVLDNSEKSQLYKAENERINALINKYHYCEKTGFYYDFFANARKGVKVKYINTKTAAAFWVLLCGAATGERLKATVKHMMSPDEFYTPSPFASLSKDDLNYDGTGGYWLGSSWHPTNFVAIRGLYNNGCKDEARRATERFLEVLAKVANDADYGGIWECYSPEEPKPATKEDGRTVVPDFVGWGGLGPITMFIENIIGLHFDAQKNTVTFDTCQSVRHGIKNMHFNGGILSIVADKNVIDINTQKPFILITNNATFHIPEGKTTVSVK